MAKSDFWSSSLPRSLPRRKVTFDDETPERPPPPARLQSINTMKDFSGVSQAYNQVLEERKQEILNPTQPQDRRNLNQDISQNEDIPEQKVSQRSEPDKDKVQDTVSQ